MTKHWYGANSIRALLITICVVALYYSFFIHFNFFQKQILKSQDLITRSVYQKQSSKINADPLVLIPIDNIDFQKVRKWPWPRALFGEFLNKLSQYKPKAIFFDIIFHGPSPSGVEDDAEFAQAIFNANNVVLASFFNKEWQYQVPFEDFTNAAYAVGFVNKPRDLDLVVRRGRALVFAENNQVIDLCAEIKVVCQYLDIPLSELYLYPDHQNPTSVELRQSETESIIVPFDERGTFSIDFTVSTENLTTIPFWRVMQEELPKDQLEGKIVLISITSEAFHDQFNTPTHEDQPGVAIGANIIQMLLKNQFLSEPSKNWVWVVSFVLAFVICLITLRFPFMISISLALLLGFGSFIGSYLLRIQHIQTDLFSNLFLIGFVFTGVTGFNYFKLLIRNSRLRQLAITDGLTGMFIYRYLVVRLKSELERASRYKLDLSFIIADIDHFKHFNDTYGHDEGNVVLKNFAQIVSENSRKTDFAARYGGEEFCLLLPHTPMEKAIQIADKLRAAIEKFPFPGPKGPLQVTASFGVSTFRPGEIETVKSLFTSADAALYRAKETGRNRVCGFDPTTDKLSEEKGEFEGDEESMPLD